MEIKYGISLLGEIMKMEGVEFLFSYPDFFPSFGGSPSLFQDGIERCQSVHSVWELWIPAFRVIKTGSRCFHRRVHREEGREDTGIPAGFFTRFLRDSHCHGIAFPGT